MKFRNKILSLEALLQKIQEWKEEGKKVVFTNGCFDLLHPGHVDLLERAADLGDELIVALNSDLSVRRLKGPERPVMKDENRAIMLAALQSVSAVVIFHEDTPLELITLVKPDVLVKGGDYTLSNIVGAEFVLNQGGRVEILKLLDNFSTSIIIETIKEK